MSNIITASEACDLAKNKANVFVEKKIDEINKLIHEACEHGFFEIKVRSCSLESINRDIVNKLKSVGYKVAYTQDLIINWEPEEYYPTPEPRLLVYLDYNAHEDVSMYFCPVCGEKYTDAYLRKYTNVFECEKCGQPLYPLKGKE